VTRYWGRLRRRDIFAVDIHLGCSRGLAVPLAYFWQRSTGPPTRFPLGTAARINCWTMSALGQKQASHPEISMSALPPIADIEGVLRNVRFVPTADMRQGASSFGGTSKKRPHCSVHDKQRGSERVSFLIRYSPLGLLPFMDFIAARFCGALFGRHCRHLLSRRGIWNAQPQRGHDCRHERKSS
jgi:hypothetical protein